MNKYFQLIRISWENGLVYRLNFFMWRVRQVLVLLTAYFLWQAVFTGREEIFGYSESRMLTYVLVAALMQAVVLASRSIDLAGVINSGDLSNILVRPISNLKYWLARDVADKSLNVMFAIGEIGLLLWLLRPSIFIPPLVRLMPLVLLVLPLSVLLYYLISYLFGLLGFWTPQVWAPRFVLLVVLQFVAGSLFPLDVLPLWLQRIVNLTPFPYLIYFPTQVYLARLTDGEMARGLVLTAVWSGVFYGIVKWVWKRGLVVYGAEGR